MINFKRALHRPLHPRVAVAGAVAAAALLLAACGDNSPDSPSSSPESNASAAPRAFNDADVTFAQAMIPHHQEALEMAGMADGRASDQRIRTLAGQIEEAQAPEIKTLRSWLTSWGKPESPGMEHSGTGHGGGDMPGMMSDEDMDALVDAVGTDFDRRFAQMMIEHHNGAIDMAKDEQENGLSGAAKKFAGKVIDDQSTEIKQMQSVLDQL
ncbi:DUF305 domain-containing protein [Streptomyces sp. NPDC048560]|uniref:DUF305 domain-containing protein n=1 Tax=Streptomyces sp. NPDC048560 TaxID=3155488 RepID=UPI0034216BA4